uniref:TSSK6 activating cochaperone n=1 Tax=Crocodylus porosus TaxID=8502 RepID=A0A7M4FK02_CROPO
MEQVPQRGLSILGEMVVAKREKNRIPACRIPELPSQAKAKASSAPCTLLSMAGSWLQKGMNHGFSKGQILMHINPQQETCTGPNLQTLSVQLYMQVMQLNKLRQSLHQTLLLPGTVFACTLRTAAH